MMIKPKLMLIIIMVSSIFLLGNTYSDKEKEISKIVDPKLDNEDIPPIEAQDEATVSTRQYVSMNDLAKSYMRFSEISAKNIPWAIEEVKNVTIQDWRQWNLSPYKDIVDITNVSGETSDKRLSANGSINNSKLSADADMVRALNVLGKSAFIPENVDSSSMSSYIHEIDPTTLISKTEAIVALYKAVGKEHFLPPMIAYRHLDDVQLEEDKNKRVAIKDTSLNSLTDANEYLFYAVDTKNAQHIVYLSNNLIEGYLWDAIQDGVIDIDELNDKGYYYVKSKYLNGVYSKAIYADKVSTSLGNGNVTNSISKEPNFLLGHTIGKKGGKNKDIGIRYTTPNALIDESITLVDFLSICRQVMYARGEEVLVPAEMKILSTTLGQEIPANMSDELYETLLYTISRGIIDNSYYDRLYDPLTWKDALIISSRIKDKGSRLTYKNIEVEYDPSLKELGYLPAKIEHSNASLSNVVHSRENRLEVFLPAVFKDSEGKYVYPTFTNTLANSIVTEVGKVDKEIYYDINNNPYYRFTVSTDEVYLNFKEINGQVPELGLPIILFLTHNQEGSYVAEFNSNDQKYIIKNSINTNEFRSEEFGMQYIKTSGDVVSPSKKGDYVKVEFSTRAKPQVEFLFRGVSEYIQISKNDYNTYPNTINKEDKNLSNYLSQLFYYTDKDEDGRDIYKVYVYMPIQDKGDYYAGIQSKISFISASNDTSINNVGYVRRLDNNDAYLNTEVLQKELGIITFLENNKVTLSSNDLTIEITHSSNKYKVKNSDGILMEFSDIIPPYREIESELLVHTSIINYLLESTGKESVSLFLNNGVLYLGDINSNIRAESNFSIKDTNWAMKIDQNINQIIPLLGDEIIPYFSPNLIYNRNGDKEKYLNLNAVHPSARPYIIQWNIKSYTEIDCYIYLVSPSGGTSDITTVVNDLKSYGIELDKSFNKRFQISKYKMSKFSNIDLKALGYNNEDYLNTMDNSIITQRLIYDPITYSVLYEIPKSSDITTLENILLMKNKDKSIISPRVPFFIENNSVIFNNIPIVNDKVSKTDIEGLNFGKDRQSLLYQNILKDTSTEIPKGATRSWYPTSLLGSKPTSELKDNLPIFVGPYYTKLLTYKGNNGEVQENTKYTTTLTNIPNWAKSIFGTKSDEYILQVKDAPINAYRGVLLPNSFISSNLNIGESLQNTTLETNQSKSLKDIVSSIYLDAGRREEIYSNITGFTSFIDLIVTNILPRLLFIILVVYQCLALVSNTGIVIAICDKFFDFYRFFSFGLMRREDIQPLRLWVTTLIGGVLLALISRRELHAIFIWIIELFASI